MVKSVKNDGSNLDSVELIENDNLDALFINSMTFRESKDGQSVMIQCFQSNTNGKLLEKVRLIVSQQHHDNIRNIKRG